MRPLCSLFASLRPPIRRLQPPGALNEQQRQPGPSRCSENPHRQSRGNRLPGDKNGPAHGDQHRRGLFRRRPEGAARRDGRRSRSHRAAAAAQILPFDRAGSSKPAASTGAEAVHPGYGFLSEKRRVRRSARRGGDRLHRPAAAAISAMGDKIESKKFAAKAGVSTVPGHLGVIANARATRRRSPRRSAIRS